MVCLPHISEVQSGGLAQSGSIQQVIRVVEEVQSLMTVTDFDEKGREVPVNCVALALLDCSKAFDRMFRPLLLHKLRKMGVTDRLFSLVAAYFCERRQRVKVGDSYSDFVLTKMGGPQGSVITLLVWLIYINDLSAVIRDAGCALFVDDVSLWLASPSESNLVDRLRGELHLIYSWACVNRVIFDFKKFHLFDMGGRISRESRVTVMYGEGAPDWSSTAPYLGVLLDKDCDFVPMMERVYSRFKNSSWRVLNHCDLDSGASPRALEMIFSSWLLPILEYGSAVWIFRLRQCFHYSYPIQPRYKNIFDKLEILYHRLAKRILGVDSSTSNMATLVRLGWMPLDYRLAYSAACWYMKIRLGLAGSALKNQFEKFSSPGRDESWANTCFYKPSHDFVSRLDHSLFSVDNFRDFRMGLERAIYAELTGRWVSCPHARICHVIHPVWTKIRWTRLIFSKQTCSWYHQIAVGRGKFSDRYKYSRNMRGCSSKCRLGCNAVDSIYHYLFDCIYCSDDISDLRLICKKKKLDYNLRNLFTNRCLQPRVELLLRKVLNL